MILRLERQANNNPVQGAVAGSTCIRPNFTALTTPSLSANRTATDYSTVDGGASLTDLDARPSGLTTVSTGAPNAGLSIAQPPEAHQTPNSNCYRCKATVADKDACSRFDSVVNQYHPIKSTRFDIYSGITQREIARETLASVIGDLPKGLLSLIRRRPTALKLAFAKQ